MNKEAKQTDCAFACCISVSWMVLYPSRRELQTLINLQFSLDFAMTSLPRIRCL